ncbi:MAG: anaerobic glycerol-3-phosphate dehydrogenase subunit C [Anaerolineales bacterium]|jgi:glycerol-3-phosphate dehydrogenase subunit C
MANSNNKIVHLGNQFSHRPVELTIDQCIKCNICVSVCPVAAVSDLFPGPKYEAPQAGRFRQARQPSPDSSVDLCSGCRVCNLACPTGVKIAEMNARARNVMVEQGKVSPLRRLRNNLIARTEITGRLGQTFYPISNFLLSNPIVRRLVDFSLGIAHAAPLPPFTRQRFSRWWQQYHNNTSQTPAGDAKNQVVYFYGCSTEYYEPRIGRAAIKVLEANGFEVIIPQQNCCGLPLLSNGEFDAAREHHIRNVSNLIEYARQGIPIVGTSTSCTLTLKEEAPELLGMDDEATQMVAAQTYDFNEFMLNHWYRTGVNGSSPTLQPVSLKLAYHAPCQYRGHRLGNLAVEVLNQIPDLEIVESHADCCGIAGTYGYKKEKYEISMAVGKPLFDFVLDVKGPVAVCDSETCRWQITHGTGYPAIHPVEIIALAYGYEPEGTLAQLKKRRLVQDATE